MTSSSNPKSELMRQALALWQKITGIDPEVSGRTMGEWAIKDMFKSVNEAIELDPTELTATLLLNHFLNEYLADRTVTLDVLLRKPDSIVERLGLCRELLGILDRPEIAARRTDFIENLQVALQQYDAADRDDVKKLLAQPDMLAILRRDALRSMKQLRVDQFLDGQPESAEVRPIYAKTVHQWWNVNSMLTAAPRIPSGVSLNLVRHPGGYQSYFAFLIRNGQNIFVLSDVPEFAHPLKAYMSRRPDRELDRRASRNWFPYDLLGVAYDEESGELYIKQTQERGLVAYQNDALPLKPVAEIGAAELVWLSMMFELIVERFWHQGYKAPTLSYAGEMLKREMALANAAEQSNLSVQNYEPLGLAPLTLADISTANVREEAVGNMCKGVNAWMEERYGHQVPEAALNLVTAPEKQLMIANNTGALVDQPDTRNQPHWILDGLREKNTLVDTVNATSFGSKEQLEKDRIFIARSNFAGAIQQLAQKEYDERKDEVYNWFKTRIMQNMDALIKWAGNEEIFVRDDTRYSKSGRCYVVELDKATHVYRSVVDRQLIDDNSHLGQYVRHIGPWFHNGPKCVVYENKPSYAVLFSPVNPAELAWLTGCQISELPDVLQHWNQSERYHGNSILNRIDPMLWKVKNPWLKLDLRFKIALSKRGMAQAIKTAELPDLPNRFDGNPKDLRK